MAEIAVYGFDLPQIDELEDYEPEDENFLTIVNLEAEQ
jgi:hypothetical protein